WGWSVPSRASSASSCLAPYSSSNRASITASPTSSNCRPRGCTTCSSAASCTASSRTNSSNRSCRSIPSLRMTSRISSSIRACWASSRSTTLSGVAYSLLPYGLLRGGVLRRDPVVRPGLVPVHVDHPLAGGVLATVDLLLHLLEPLVLL